MSNKLNDKNNPRNTRHQRSPKLVTDFPIQIHREKELCRTIPRGSKTNFSESEAFVDE